MNIMYYCIISVIVLISSLFYVNIKHSDELSDAFGTYALCLLVSLSWPISLTALIVAGTVYILNLCVKKIIDVLNLK